MATELETDDDTELETDDDRERIGMCDDDRCTRNNKDPTKLWHCVYCGRKYCDACWPLQVPHKPKKRGPRVPLHEKIDLDVFSRLQSILNPSTDPVATQRLHQEDERTKWFGVTRDDTGQMVFEDYGRYAALVSDTARVASMENRYPKLVSFVGVTGAGKSTMVKMLVQRSATSGDRNFDAVFPSPVVGSVVDDTRTTTDNVRLYIDPAKHLDPLPTFYADCEGFEGGERAPMGSQYHECSGENRDGMTEAWINTRPIKWADKEEYRRREYAVTVLYPRILYSFSDCVVFVLRNPKTFGSAALTKLLDWGAAALEKSMNQPALPHCIVALNDSHPDLNAGQWDIEHATESLLDSVGDAYDGIQSVPQFRDLASHWRQLGREVNNIKDLILCYYASFKVVRIPAGPRYTLISQQIDKLHATIRTDCEASHETKRRARLLTNADELNLYLQSGFDHFAAHIDIPFNFMQVSLMRNPIPGDFGGHILHLCETLNSRIPSREPAMVRWMFQKISVMLASCVLLDCARFRKGQLHELFSNYTRFFEHAMAEYLQLHCPCSFVSPDGTRLCKSVKARHQTKGHQDERGIIAAGDYVSVFDDTFKRDWMHQLEAAITDLHRTFSKELDRSARVPRHVGLSEERIAFAIHVDHLNHFYRSIGPATWVRSHSTCYCCLMDVPQHALPCGHALCDMCARACGDLKQSTLLVPWCPLHRDATQWLQPKVIKYKPQGAGVRVLALDGGGIRGVVQLEILRGIQKALGKHLPVQVFFDLVVGTGTGGLIAVALAEQGRTLDQCHDTFNAVCKQAYTNKTPGKALVMRVTRAFSSRSRDEASALCEVLKQEFSDNCDFFGNTTRFRPDAKVAVIAASAIRHKTTLLSSYRRVSDGCSGQGNDSGGDRNLDFAYDYERPHDPADELKAFQAVYATVADPQYFAPLSSGGQYGGAPKFSNIPHVALAEARRIWPDVEEPDLLLSLGTGQDRAAILDELLAHPSNNNPAHHKPWHQKGLESAKNFTKRYTRTNNDIFNAERGWQEFTSTVVRQGTRLSRRSRIRFNVDLGEPPAQTEESQIQRLSTLVRDKLQEEHRIEALSNVANRLIATSFYFKADATTIDLHGGRYTIGRITCRFDSHSDYTKRLGKLLDDRCRPEFEPFFLIDSACDESPSRVVLTSANLSRMIQHGVFEVPEIKLPKGSEPDATLIRLHLSQNDRLEPEGYPISGTFCSKVEEPDPSSTQSTPHESLPSKKLPTSSRNKGQTRPPAQLQDSLEPMRIATPALLEGRNLPARPAIAKPKHLFDTQKFLCGEMADTQEFPPPYNLGAQK